MRIMESKTYGPEGVPVLNPVPIATYQNHHGQPRYTRLQIAVEHI